MKYFIPIAALSMCLFFQTYTRKKLHKKKPFIPNITNLNVMTLRPQIIKEASHIHYDLEALVKKIHSGNPPYTACITGPSNQDETCLPYKIGIDINDTDQTVFIFSRGYAKKNKPGTNENFIKKGACAVAAYTQLTHNIINQGPCVSFDYPDEKRFFNFGQKTDQDCLEFVYHQVRKHAPSASIVLIGDCRGARTALKFTANHPHHLKAVILMSPFLSARSLTNSIARNYLQWFPRSSDILHGLFKWWFPNYQINEDWSLDSLTPHATLPPILIGHRVGDSLVPDHEIEKLVLYLRSAGNTNIYFLPVRDNTAPHSRLPTIEFFQRGTNTFLKSHKLPYQNNLAVPYNPLLDFMKTTHQCTNAPTPISIKFTK